MTCKIKNGYSCEPSLDEVLNDPVVQAVMARDGVNRAEIQDLAASVKRRFDDEDED